MSAFFSWSGGKDSMLALHRALAAGTRVEALLAMFDEGGERSRSHAIPPQLMQAQADALGIELVIGRAGWADYEAVFIGAAARVRGARHHARPVRRHRPAAAPRLGREGLRRRRPARRSCRCGRSRAARWSTNCSHSATARGVVCVDARFLDASFCGREFDAAFLADLPEGVDACGENGEFHTFVFDGPRFARPVPHELVDGARDPPERARARPPLRARSCVDARQGAGLAVRPRQHAARRAATRPSARINRAMTEYIVRDLGIDRAEAVALRQPLLAPLRRDAARPGAPPRRARGALPATRRIGCPGSKRTLRSHAHDLRRAAPAAGAQVHPDQRAARLHRCACWARCGCARCVRRRDQHRGHDACSASSPQARRAHVPPRAGAPERAGPRAACWWRTRWCTRRPRTALGMRTVWMQRYLDGRFRGTLRDANRQRGASDTKVGVHPCRQPRLCVCQNQFAARRCAHLSMSHSNHACRPTLPAETPTQPDGGPGATTRRPQRRRASAPSRASGASRSCRRWPRMLEQPGAERITTAALAAKLEVSEAALYRHFASKAQMFEGLIEFIESSVFTLVNQIVERETDAARAGAARCSPCCCSSARRTPA